MGRHGGDELLARQMGADYRITYRNRVDRVLIAVDQLLQLLNPCGPSIGSGAQGLLHQVTDAGKLNGIGAGCTSRRGKRWPRIINDFTARARLVEIELGCVCRIAAAVDSHCFLSRACPCIAACGMKFKLFYTAGRLTSAPEFS